MKQCIKCNHIRTLDSFYKNKAMSSGRINECKECMKAKVKSWQKSNPDKDKLNRAAERKRNKETYYQKRIEKQYGVCPETYSRMLASQDNKCAICKVDKKDLNTRFHVDHSHKTGKVRGLLCPSCNVGLGQFKDDFERVNAASKYLHEAEGII